MGLSPSRDDDSSTPSSESRTAHTHTRTHTRTHAHDRGGRSSSSSSSRRSLNMGGNVNQNNTRSGRGSSHVDEMRSTTWNGEEGSRNQMQSQSEHDEGAAMLLEALRGSRGQFPSPSPSPSPPSPYPSSSSNNGNNGGSAHRRWSWRGFGAHLGRGSFQSQNQNQNQNQNQSANDGDASGSKKTTKKARTIPILDEVEAQPEGEGEGEAEAEAEGESEQDDRNSQDRREENLCYICSLNERSHKALPCTHEACKRCFERWLQDQGHDTCLICAQALEKVVKLRKSLPSTFSVDDDDEEDEEDEEEGEGQQQQQQQKDHTDPADLSNGGTGTGVAETETTPNVNAEAKSQAEAKAQGKERGGKPDSGNDAKKNATTTTTAAATKKKEKKKKKKRNRFRGISSTLNSLLEDVLRELLFMKDEGSQVAEKLLGVRGHLLDLVSNENAGEYGDAVVAVEQTVIGEQIEKLRGLSFDAALKQTALIREELGKLGKIFDEYTTTFETKSNNETNVLASTSVKSKNSQQDNQGRGKEREKEGGEEEKEEEKGGDGSGNSGNFHGTRQSVQAPESKGGAVDSSGSNHNGNGDAQDTGKRSAEQAAQVSASKDEKNVASTSTSTIPTTAVEERELEVIQSSLEDLVAGNTIKAQHNIVQTTFTQEIFAHIPDMMRVCGTRQMLELTSSIEPRLRTELSSLESELDALHSEAEIAIVQIVSSRERE